MDAAEPFYEKKFHDDTDFMLSGIQRECYARTILSKTLMPFASVVLVVVTKNLLIWHRKY